MADGILNLILSQLDNAKRVAVRNTKDFISNPSDFISMVTGRLDESNKKLASGDSESLNELVGNSIPGGGGLLGTFVGKGSKSTLVQKMFKEAEQLKAEGATSREIFQATSKFDSPGDRKPRIEISDLGMTGKKQLINTEGKTTLGELIDHPALFESYPEFSSIPVILDKTTRNAGLLAYPNSGKLEMKLGTAKDQQGILSTILHEVQHGIQFKEGFARGDSVDAIQKELDTAFPGQDNRTQAVMRYLRSSGEAESRAVEERFNNPQLMNRPPIENYPIAIQDLITKFY